VLVVLCLGAFFATSTVVVDAVKHIRVQSSLNQLSLLDKSPQPPL
jgi:hypothetical protein